MPKVSVIIPTYNRANYLSRAIDSVFDQTYQDFEVIVVDDGSTDNTKEVLVKYGNKIRCFCQENKGVSAARNVGIREAQGEWIAFLDSDDIWLPEKLKSQNDIINLYTDIPLISTDAEAFNDTGIIKHSLMRPRNIPNEDCIRYKILKMKVNDENILICDLYKSLLLYGGIVIFPTAMIKKDCLLQVGCFNEDLKAAEDYELTLRIAQHYPMLYFNKITARCRITDDGLSGELDMRVFRYKEWDGKMFEIHMKNCPKKYKIFVKKRIVECYGYAIWGYLNGYDLKNVKKLCCRSLRHNKFQIKLYLYWLLSLFPSKFVLFLRRVKLQLCQE